MHAATYYYYEKTVEILKKAWTKTRLIKGDSYQPADTIPIVNLIQHLHSVNSISSLCVICNFLPSLCTRCLLNSWKHFNNYFTKLYHTHDKISKIVAATIVLWDCEFVRTKNTNKYINIVQPVAKTVRDAFQKCYSIKK